MNKLPFCRRTKQDERRPRRKNGDTIHQITLYILRLEHQQILISEREQLGAPTKSLMLA